MSEPKYYQYITDLPMRRFIDCAVDGNLSALTIEGFPTPKQLQQAWFEIQQQYTDAIGDTELKIYWKLVAEVQVIHINIQFVNKAAPTMLELLETLYDDQLDLSQEDYMAIIAYLKESGTELNAITHSSFPFDHNNYTQFQKDIKTSVSKAKALTIEYQLKESQRQAMQSKSEEGGKPTKEYYIGLLMTLSDGAGYKLTIDSETVYEFCERIRRHQKSPSTQWLPKKT